jgi:hypothetical protein
MELSYRNLRSPKFDVKLKKITFVSDILIRNNVKLLYINK